MLNKRVEVLMDEEVLEHLIAFSKDWRCSRGSVVRALIMEKVAENETQSEDSQQALSPDE